MSDTAPEPAKAPTKAAPPPPPSREKRGQSLSSQQPLTEQPTNPEIKQEEVIEENEEPIDLVNGEPISGATVGPGKYKFYRAYVEGNEDDIVQMRVSRTVSAGAAHIYLNYPKEPGRDQYYPDQDYHDWNPTKGPIVGPPGEYRIVVQGVPSFIEKDDKWLIDPSSNWATFDLFVDWNLMDQTEKDLYLKIKEQYTREAKSSVWSSGYNKELNEKYKKMMEEYNTQDQVAEDGVTTGSQITAEGTPIASNYTVGTKLGSGDYTTVLKAKQNSSGKEFALKIVDKQGAQLRGVDESALKRQMSILKSLQSEGRVAKLVDSFENEKGIFLVTELYGNDLTRHIASLSTYTEEDAKNYARQVLQAVDSLHSKNIVHKNIEPSSILVKPGTNEVALVGFNNSQLTTEDIDFLGCSSPFQAPEVISHGTLGKELDLWASGAVIYLLLSGRLPFEDTNQFKLQSKIRQGSYEFPTESWNDVSQEAQDVVKSLMNADAKERTSAKSALAKPWFSAKNDKPLPSVRTNLVQFNNSL